MENKIMDDILQTIFGIGEILVETGAEIFGVIADGAIEISSLVNQPQKEEEE